MELPRKRQHPVLAGLAVLAALSTCAWLLLLNSPAANSGPARDATVAAPQTVPDPTSPVTANATHFDGLGSPYGGCGLPQSVLETQNFVALNVYNTPGDYNFYPRPIPPDNASKMGIWNNGLNCGRWVQVSIGDFCTGTNDGAPNQPFCRNGSWVSDAYNGATLTMLVADSCGDSNAWCRDDPYHLDLATDSLNRFVKNGTPVGDLNPNHWNNRHISWQFVPAPNYTGDIQIGFLQGAQMWWPAIAVSHLANGIHSVEYFANGTWNTAQPDSDMGQAFILGGGATTFQIRVRDVTGALINNGRVYTFSLPSSCGSNCSAAYTQVPYTTRTDPTPTPTPSTGSPAPAPAGGSGGGGALTVSVTASWQGGYQANVTVKNNGTTASTAWTSGFTFPGTQTIANSWNAVVQQSGAQVSATSASFNGTIPPGGSTSWGMTVNGADQPPTNQACSLR